MPLNLRIPVYSPLFVGTRNVRNTKRKWARAVSAADLTESITNRKILIPRIYDVEIASATGYEISAVVDMSTVGKTSRDLQRKAEVLTSVLQAYQIRVEKITPSHSKITIHYRRPTNKHRAEDTENSGLLDLEEFPVHLDPTDDAPVVSLTTSLLIGGATESGKSNLVWYLLSQLNDYGIPYRLWVIDPGGGVELADLEESPLTRQYVDRVKDIPAIIQAFRKSMDNRLVMMKSRKQRRHFPTSIEPVEILIIDELLLCKSQLQGGDAASPLGEVLAVGRKGLHIVIACSQLGEKLVIGQIRDLFQQRICLRTRSDDVTDAVLGSNATVDGATCHRITQKGEGYVFTDTSGLFEKFHAPLVENTAEIAQGYSIPPQEIPMKRRKFF